MGRPLVIDLYCGLGGWSEGFLSEGWDCIGFDIERHDYGTGGYPAQLVLQDVLTINGSQFRNADAIVASPPCQEFSFAAMPWKIAKAQKPEVLPSWWEKPEPMMSESEMAEWKAWRAAHPATPPSTALFDACSRIQREACDAAGHYIPLVIENVKGAQPWVGRAQANYGSYYLWGDVRNVGGRIVRPDAGFGASCVRAWRAEKFNPDGTAHGQGSWFAVADSKNRGARGVKQGGSGAAWFDEALDERRRKATTDSFGWDKSTPLRNNNSHSSARKAASAQIAKIPSELSRWVAQCFLPVSHS